MNFIKLLINKIKYEHECRKNWEEKMNDPIVPFPLNCEERKHLISKGKLAESKYELKFMFDWGAHSCLWSNNEAANDKYGVGPIALEILPLSVETRNLLKDLCDMHDEALDWGCPQNGVVWTPEECCEFREKARAACWKVIHELGPEYGVSFDRDTLI